MENSLSVTKAYNLPLRPKFSKAQVLVRLRVSFRVLTIYKKGLTKTQSILFLFRVVNFPSLTKRHHVLPIHLSPTIETPIILKLKSVPSHDSFAFHLCLGRWS